MTEKLRRQTDHRPHARDQFDQWCTLMVANRRRDGARNEDEMLIKLSHGDEFRCGTEQWWWNNWSEKIASIDEWVLLLQVTPEVCGEMGSFHISDDNSNFRLKQLWEIEKNTFVKYVSKGFHFWKANRRLLKTGHVDLSFVHGIYYL